MYKCTSTAWWSFWQPVTLFFSSQVPGKTLLWEKATVYISFVNPLPVALKGGVFTVEGAGLLSATQVFVKWVVTQPVLWAVRKACKNCKLFVWQWKLPPGGELRFLAEPFGPHSKQRGAKQYWDPLVERSPSFLKNVFKYFFFNYHWLDWLVFQWGRGTRPKSGCQALLLTSADRRQEAPGGFRLQPTERRERLCHCGRPQEIFPADNGA